MMTVGSLALDTVKLFADQVKHPTTRIYALVTKKMDGNKPDKNWREKNCRKKSGESSSAAVRINQDDM